ncbi:MAG: GH92 family glycosyl hydrolase, partial [Marinilabiliaceae bacterium]
MSTIKTLQNLILAGAIMFLSACSEPADVLWEIGQDDQSAEEFALAPSGYDKFLENDFGFEDRSFIVGVSGDSTDWPYVLPGPSDTWGGTSGTAGWRSHYLNILFGLKDAAQGPYTLVLDVNDYNPGQSPLVRITINGEHWKYQLPAGKDTIETPDASTRQRSFTARTEIPRGLLKEGGNEITVSTVWGSWLVFDQLRLEGPASVELEQPGTLFVRNVRAGEYEKETDGERFQPLLVDVEHIDGRSPLKVILDGEEIFRETPESGRYEFEVPMPAVGEETSSEYVIKSDGETLRKGTVDRGPQELVTASDYVNTMRGSAHSRWMIAPGPWMPFSMVKLSPDNQDKGWQAGYDPIFESIHGFSHIHEWTLAGLLTMPVTGPVVTEEGSQSDPDSGYRSRIDKTTEEAPLGYYKVDLTDYDITAEVTSTTRCGFQRYTYSNADTGRVLLDIYFPAEYDFLLDEVEITKVSNHRVEGYSKQRTPNTWAGGITQEYTIHFVAEFDQPIANVGVWTEEGPRPDSSFSVESPEDAGMYVEFDTRDEKTVSMRTGISYVSVDNAALNLKEEISGPFGWDFDEVVAFHRETWDELLSRIEIQSNDRREKERFYTNMYRSFCSRNTYNDVDGRWVDANEEIRQFEDPDKVALGCDAFWNTFWNLNQLWNLAAPDWSNRWVNSQLAMYDAHGWLAKGPAGMEYIPVMVAEHEIPLIVSAWQMGIRDFDGEKALEAAVKMQTTPGQKVAGGFAGNRDLEAYLEHQYVPDDKGRYSNSLEYSFDDWTVSQLAKSLGDESTYEKFRERGYWWRNTIDPETGFARLRNSEGNWEKDFDPFRSGANHHYVEGNAWQLTFFVPQDVPALIDEIGEERFLERLEWGFEESEKWRYNAPNDQYWDFPVIQGNQQSMHFAFLFNWAGKPWLTQKWSRSIMERYYGHGLANAYLGDEDQGQMSAWFVMASMGLFQTDGGTRAEPVYEIASPLYPKVEIDLGGRFGRGEKFVIEANNVSRSNKYVQSAKLNGEPLDDFYFPAEQLLQGGKLELEMGDEPN